MKTIQACVSPRLLTKASRLFTGTLDGRIIEILQNARRAGATRVEIKNADDLITVRDNGKGIDDFSKLLDLGASGWEELDESEDPAGVGVFCLAPRSVTIRSKGYQVTINGDGWTGKPSEIEDDPNAVEGTTIQFADDPWTMEFVERHAVFCGMSVSVDGETCASEPFLSKGASHHEQLGCRIEVRESSQLDSWHRNLRPLWRNVLVNFHGQVIALDYHPVDQPELNYLVDLTGEATSIRLMLPARTQLVENDALAELKGALELEALRFLQKKGTHRLPYKEYLRAASLGIKLPEAEPTFQVGVLDAHDSPDPVEVTMPKDFPLSRCYRFNGNAHGHEADEANVHLLAALGKFTEPFIPVEIRKCFDGYSWAGLPTIEKVEVTAGQEVFSTLMWSGSLTCVESLVITAHASNGRTFSSRVCMAISPKPLKESLSWLDENVLVTREAMNRLCPSEVWYHLGGYCDEGDTYETQESSFSEELERFWKDVIGPDEHIRTALMDVLRGVDDWRRVIVHPDGRVAIQFPDQPQKQLAPAGLGIGAV